MVADAAAEAEMALRREALINARSTLAICSLRFSPASHCMQEA